MAWNAFKPKAIADALQTAEDKICEEARLKAGFEKQEAFLSALGKSTEFTPDVHYLESRMRWYLFVPDELMKAHPDHARLGNSAKIVSEAFTVDKFSLWKQRLEKSATAIPLRIGYGEEALFKSPRVVIRYALRGELFFVNAATLIKLDRHRENGVKFQRERVKVQIPYTQIQLRKIPLSIEGQQPTTTFVKEENRLLGEPLNVWMYVGVSEYWEPILDNGHTFAPVRRFKPNNPLLSTYYHFSPEEYER